MNCRVFEDNISSYLDGELKDIDKIEFELHLLKCRDCRQKYENVINIVKLLKEKNEVELPKDYHNILIEKINNVKTERKKSFNNWRIWTSIAATLIIFISSALILNNINNNVTKDESILESAVSKPTMEVSDLRSEDIVEKEGDKEVENKKVITTYELAPEANMDIGFNKNKVISRSSRGMVCKRKLIKQQNIEILASQYDNTIDKIIEYIKELGGYVESLTIDYGTVEKEEKTFYIKNGSIKLRISDDKFEETIDFIKNISDIERIQYIEKDITEIYFETENIINTLRSQEDRLVDVMEQTKNIDKTVDLLKELTRIRIDIASNTRELQNLDNTIYMPEINLKLRKINN